MEAEEVVWGRNAVLEALRGRRPVRRVMIAHGTQDKGSLGDVVGLAQSRGVTVQRVPREAIDRVVGNSHHQGVAAVTTPYDYAEVEDILAEAKARSEDPFLLLLDSVQDPQNVGSLIRTAEAAGAHGLVIPKHRAAGLTAAVGRASAGAIEHLKVAQITNLSRTLEELKQAGLWVVGVDMKGHQAYDEADMRGPLALVVGSEGEGLHRLVREKCDFTVRLPMRGKVASLNAAVAGAIVLFEAMRQRERGKRT